MEELEALYRRYYKDICLYLRTLTEDSALAEDLTAETFLRAYQRIGQFRGDCDIRTWLCQIAKNLYLSHCRKEKRLVPLPEQEDTADPCVDLEQSYEDRETAELIHQYLHRMKAPYKEVFTLRVFCELPFAQIAALFGKTEGWARVTFLRAKRQIQDWIGDGMK
ncbi:MAG: RNA polymerase sigma factor [Clostridiales bacterium]|nr:RNA polymerase sigma factor [Clostridiales bacterium]